MWWWKEIAKEKRRKIARKSSMKILEKRLRPQSQRRVSRRQLTQHPVMKLFVGSTGLGNASLAKKAMTKDLSVQKVTQRHVDNLMKKDQTDVTSSAQGESSIDPSVRNCSKVSA